MKIPQLCIRYTLQLGAISLPKTGNPEHMKSNAQLDFQISAEDMELLKNFKKIKSYGDSGIFPVYGGKNVRNLTTNGLISVGNPNIE